MFWNIDTNQGSFEATILKEALQEIGNYCIDYLNNEHSPLPNIKYISFIDNVGEHIVSEDGLLQAQKELENIYEALIEQYEDECAYNDETKPFSYM